MLFILISGILLYPNPLLITLTPITCPNGFTLRSNSAPSPPLPGPTVTLSPAVYPIPVLIIITSVIIGTAFPPGSDTVTPAPTAGTVTVSGSDVT